MNFMPDKFSFAAFNNVLVLWICYALNSRKPYSVYQIHHRTDTNRTLVRDKK